MDRGNMISAGIAAVSALIALASLFVTIVFVRRQTGMQARLTEIEEARRREEIQAQHQARLSVDVEPGRQDVGLVIRNSGPATARAVRVDAQSTSGEDRPMIHGLDGPAVDLPAGSRVAFPMLRFGSAAKALRVQVTWTDGAGQHEETCTVRVT
jgi:hypothetical protein